MQRIKLKIAYDGSKYRGFQSQKSHSNTIINTLQKALKSLGIFETPIGSGRTDKGVHANNQILHLDIPNYWVDRLEKLKDQLNNKLYYIHIKKISLTNNSFHARYHAKKRAYRYIISSKENVFQNNYIHYQKNLNFSKIKEAIPYLLGEHDFEYFRKTGSDEKSTIRIIYDINFYKYKNYFIFKIQGNGFLRSQIRIIIGFLIQISQEKLTNHDLEEQLKKKINIYNKPISATGLYLHRIYY
ncbi:MAG: tRNA pseudouridine synthase A (EC [uncultured Campylobacterales bacterium]|uniref:tRNA pseudouridine synthase A n=1 Tax=uncultured Campylobacterales bacterium TaxID=352960 RepID=A0A6S6SR00_9BACT|nr:MAG: tRNA pseudouridine synthase A (EC [uncultured Campylobacterales bacterium]